MKKSSESQKLRCEQYTKASDTRAVAAQAKVPAEIGARTENNSANVARIRTAEERTLGQKTEERKEERVKRKDERMAADTVDMWANGVQFSIWQGQ